MPKNNLAGQLATFFVHLYIKLTIFSHNSEEKKWASGQKTRKPLRHKAFSLASFEIKVGKKWADGQFSLFFRPYKANSPAKFTLKVGRWPVSRPKSGQENINFQTCYYYC
jgi:hypothetical protein